MKSGAILASARGPVWGAARGGGNADGGSLAGFLILDEGRAPTSRKVCAGLARSKRLCVTETLQGLITGGISLLMMLQPHAF